MFKIKSFGLFSKQFQKNYTMMNRSVPNFAFSSKSHLELIRERDNEIMQNLQNGSNFSVEEIGEFARVLKKQGGDAELFKKFEGEMLKNLNSFTEIELRKVISLIISENNRGYLRSDSVIDTLSERLDLIYTAKDRNDVPLEEFKKTKRNFLRNNSAPNKFWIYMYSLRIRFLSKFKNFGILAK